MPDPSLNLQPLLNIWNVGAIQSTKKPTTGGTIDNVLLITTDQNQYALRASAHNDPTRLQREHQLILWAHQHNIPTPPPMSTPQGNTVVTYNKQVYTLFPFVNGYQIPRSDLQPNHITAMGSFLAQTHTTLANYPTSQVRARNLNKETDANCETTLANLDRLIKKISALPYPKETDQHGLHRLQTRREWLQTQPTSQNSDLLTLPYQAIHGDYQETNLFFQNDQISSIIDWSAYVAPTTWEIARILDIVFGFQPNPSLTFLQAYHQHHPLSLKDLDTATHAYGLKNAHSLWLYEEIYDHDNHRLRQFITPGPFTPLCQTWQTLYPLLQSHFSY